LRRIAELLVIRPIIKIGGYRKRAFERILSWRHSVGS